MWAKSNKVEECIAAVQLMFRMYPLEMAKWSLQNQHDENSGYKLLEAHYIEQDSALKMYPVPEKKKKKKDIISEAISEGIIKTIKSEATDNEDITISTIHLDHDELARQTILKGGCEVELLIKDSFNENRINKGIMAVMIMPPQHDGSELNNEVICNLSWQCIAYEELVIKNLTEEEQEKGYMFMPYIIFKPLFLFFGTGLKDGGIFESFEPKISKDDGILGFLCGDDESEEEQAKRRNDNLKWKKLSEDRDRERREAARKREEMIGDSMINENELDEMVPQIDVKKGNRNLGIGWVSWRIWEKPVDDLLNELPLGGLGLALFAYNQHDETPLQLFRRCAWKLRGRISEAGLNPEEVNRVLIPLLATAKICLNEDDIFDVLNEVKLFR